jgi:hypothetical protein
VLREGPIPPAVHGALEYCVGAFLVAAPFLFDFVSGVATGLSVALGVILLAVAASSRGPTGLAKSIPVGAHVTIDVVLAVFLVAAPFVFGFSAEPAPRNLFLVLGVVHLLITIGTRFPAAAGTGRGTRPLG